LQKRLKYTKTEKRYIRSKKFAKRLSSKHAERIATRALVRAWEKYCRAYDYVVLPNPTKRQKIYGGSFNKETMQIFRAQIKFLVKNFVSNLEKKKRARAKKLLLALRPRMLTIPAVLKEHDKTDVGKMYEAAIELYEYLKNRGEMYPALLQESTGRIYLAKGWEADQDTFAGPIHEAIHYLALKEIIALDVPFAYTADLVYSLERGIKKFDKKMRMPTPRELDKMPVIFRTKKGKYHFAEPYSSHELGYRIGQYIYKKIPSPRKRWKYLALRCEGIPHREALRKIRE
jgi:hypothetical protein